MTHLEALLARRVAEGARRGSGRAGGLHAMGAVIVAGLVAAVLLSGGAGSLRAQGARQAIPRATREALLGCWDLGDGEVHVVEAHGAHGLRSRWVAPGRHGPERFEESMSFQPEPGVVVGGCGARTQHGQHCLFQPRGDRVEVRLVSRRTGRAVGVRQASRCAEGVTVAPAAAPERRSAATGAPVHPISRRVGARRRAIEAARAPTGEEGGWVRYGDELAIRYEAGVAMAVRAVLAASDCEEAARLAGYPPRPGSGPLRRERSCEWPGVSARHRLGPRVGARYEGGVFEVWRR